MLSGEPGYNRGGSCAGAAAHAGGDEHHVCRAKRFHQVIHRFFSRGAPDVGPGASAKAMGDARAKLDGFICQRLRQRLGIRIGDNKLDAFKLRRNHVVDGVAAGAADADNGNAGFQMVLRYGNGEIDSHSGLLDREGTKTGGVDPPGLGKSAASPRRGIFGFG